ncbi:MAG: tetratricopeptide repeat protein [Chitinophagaceae bacterium]|nr:tetratricopeptide repeat protein [Chitinophagaceae bacterium]
MKNLITSILCLASISLFAQTTDSAAFYYQKGIEEKTAKRFLVAQKHFDKAISLNNSYVQAYIDRAFTNLEMRKMNMALTDFEKVYELEPANTVAIGELASLYFSFKKYQKAIEFANKCKTCGNSQRIIALSYYNDENYGLAEKALRAYIQDKTADAEVTLALARTYLELENEKKAIEYYEAALKADPTKASWYSELGLIYYNINQYKKAAECFTNAVKNGLTQSNDFRENYAFAYIYAGDSQNAEPILRDLVNRKAGNKEILRDIAEAYYASKQYDNSLKYCQQLMEMDAKDGKALYQAGLCFQKKGEKDRGQKMCDVAIDMDPSLSRMRTKQSLPGGL